MINSNKVQETSQSQDLYKGSTGEGGILKIHHTKNSIFAFDSILW